MLLCVCGCVARWGRRGNVRDRFKKVCV